MTDTRPLSDDAAALRATEKWFVAHGLPYFVPEERNAARAALHSRRTLLTFTALVLLTVVGGVVLAFQVRDVATAPTFVMVVIGVVVRGRARNRSVSGPGSIRAAAMRR